MSVNKTLIYLNRKPKPILLSIFFSKFQKNLNCPRSHPKNMSSTWYMGKMIKTRSVQYSKEKYQSFPKSSLVNPIASRIGFATFTEEDPVNAKTNSITNSSKLLVIPQRAFNFSMSFFLRANIFNYIRGKKGPSR